MTARRFLLRRRVDRTGVSGIGDVAEGVLWSDGTAVLRWRSPLPSTTHYDQGMRAVEGVHGHGGLTDVVWLDSTVESPDIRRSGTAWERHDDPTVPLDPSADYPDEVDSLERFEPFADGDGR